MPHEVFISYSTSNSVEAQAICAALEASGLTCWIAPRDIRSGTSWSDAIMEALHDCRVVMLLLSSASNVSVQVHNEVNAATNLKKAILPLRLDPTPLSRHMTYYLGRLHWHSAVSAPFDSCLLTLPQAVQALLEAGEQEFVPPAPAVEAPRHNLPRQMNPFIGREKQQAELQALLATAPLVTLLGPGGIGKTRLALQVAEAVRERYREGVWMVELAELTEPSLLAQTVASALGMREEPGQSLTRTLLDYFKGKHLLLLLDNCEHLIAACATLAASLLKACPHLTILATSRELLQIPGENAYPVPSLAVPDSRHLPAIESLAEYEAVRLFLDRALLVQPAFAITPANALSLASLCQRLDGIPLALELSAARIRSLSVEEINARLDNRFRLLTGGSRAALPRQQTLRALIDWSYDLLNAREKALFHRLSVFAGGWTLEAAEQVCSGGEIEEWEALDLLTSLVDKSLVVAETEQGKTRYRLLETLREYGRDRLEESGEAEILRQRHQAFFVALAVEAEPKLKGAEQTEWLKHLEDEHENLRSALDESFKQKEGSPNTLSGETALRFCGMLQRFWWTRGHLSEGREWSERALRQTDAQERTRERARTLHGAGVMARMQGDYISARTYHEQSLDIQREFGDREGIAISLNSLGSVTEAQGEYASALAYHEESLAIRREIGDRRGIAASLNSLGNIAYYQSDFDSARAYFEQSLDIQREVGDRKGIATSLNNLGNVTEVQGDYASARSCHDESLSLFREIGDRRGIAASLNSLGNVTSDQNDFDSARVYYKECLDIQQEMGDRSAAATSLNNLGLMAHHQSDFAFARACYEQSLSLVREIGDRNGVALSLNNLGLVADSLEDYASALAYHEESLSIRREIGDRSGVAYSLHSLGNVAYLQGDYASARARYEQSLNIKREIGDRIGIAYALEAFARLAVKESKSEQAAALWGAAEALREQIGSSMPPSDRERNGRYVMEAAVMLGTAAFMTAWAAGRTMTMEQASADARRGTGL